MKTTIAVIAHSAKTFEGGLSQLRELLTAAGYPKPLWYEVAKSDQAPDCARKALAKGAELIFVWGGDGTVQRCIDAVANSGATIAILPAGTANLLAKNLGIPKELEAAVQVGLHGDRRPLDTGTINGEHFALMAGAGLAAKTMKDVDAGLKDRIGRASYLWAGARELDANPVKATIEVEGREFYKGKISCVLVGNMGEVFAGIEVFADSRPDDGVLEIGVITAKSRLQWLRTIAGVVVGRAEDSPFVVTTRGKSIKVKFAKKTVFELDGGVRRATKKLKIKVHPSSVTVCVPVPISGAAETKA